MHKGTEGGIRGKHGEIFIDFNFNCISADSRSNCSDVIEPSLPLVDDLPDVFFIIVWFKGIDDLKLMLKLK